jgi:alpha-ketoglutarate-dependent 2,4-dichlorophenoxyacetate dioxygenase
MAISAPTIAVTPVHRYFAARVEGVDLAQPLSDQTFREIASAFEEHSVLIFPGQRLTDEQQMTFSRRFGPLETTIKSPGQEARFNENLVDLSNLAPDDDTSLMDWKDRRMIYQAGNQLWHTDSSFKPVPAHASLLSGREVPPTGGETEFVSMRHAYATLPEDLKRDLEGKIAVHSIIYSRSLIADSLFHPEQEAALPPVRHQLVRANPVNGKKAIFIGSHASHIEGLPVAEARSLLERLLTHTTRPECVYQHKWTQWDLVMWDNRCVLHRGRPWDAGKDRRVMRRTTVAGEGPTADPPYADDEAKRVIAASVEANARSRKGTAL